MKVYFVLSKHLPEFDERIRKALKFGKIYMNKQEAEYEARRLNINKVKKIWFKYHGTDYTPTPYEVERAYDTFYVYEVDKSEAPNETEENLAKQERFIKKWIICLNDLYGTVPKGGYDV